MIGSTRSIGCCHRWPPCETSWKWEGGATRAWTLSAWTQLIRQLPMVTLVWQSCTSRPGMWHIRDPTTPVPNKHIRCSPSSPQFQCKLEAPLRVILQALNQDRAHPNPQLTILWKTLTVMSPQSVRAFDPQPEPCARLHYVQDTCGTFTHSYAAWPTEPENRWITAGGCGNSAGFVPCLETN